MVTRFEIRNELRIVQEATRQLDEKFLNQNDPSVSILNFIEEVSGSISVIKSMYIRDSADRNKIVAAVDHEVEKIREACRQMKIRLRRVEIGAEPEDVNKRIDL